MENNLPDRDPVLPVVENASEPIQSPPPTAPQNKSIIFPLLTVVLIIGAFALGYFFKQVVPTNSTDKTGEQNKIAENNEFPTASVSTAKKEIKTEFLFTKDPNQDVAYDLQAWLLPLDGEAQQIFLPDFSVAYKYPKSQKIFFTKTAANGQADGSIFVKDLATNETKQYELIKHPKEEVNESLNISNLDSIAPDDSMMVYSVYFSQACPPITIEPGFEGGFGPCEPDPDPNLKAGYYLYDFVSKTNTYIGEVVIPSVWDMENKKFYYNTLDYQNNGLKVIDLATKQISMFDKAVTFGYGAYPLLKSNFIVKIEGQTGDVAGQESSSVLGLYNVTTKEKKVLDSGRWAAIQPFASIAPDESKFLYIRSTLDSQGRAVYSLHSYDFKSGKTKKVTPDSMTSSYSIYGSWIDENNFVTIVNETGSNYNSGKNYLVKIDLISEQVTKLTDDGVYRFNQN